MRSRPHRARGQAGLTLMEILVTLVVIIIGLLGLMKVAAVAVHSNQKSLRMSLAADKGQARIEATYRSNYQRLTQLKGRYDPSNLFRINQNIKPVA